MGKPERARERKRKSQWDERHGRWARLTTWEECLAVERCGSGRDTMERMERAGKPRHRWATRQVEWSFWEKRHRRLNCEGSSERVGEGASFKWAGAHESTWVANEFQSDSSLFLLITRRSSFMR